ncbi:choline ABC transporter substrate-binding protein [Azospirillum sp. SYSU D00513]|uniref:choline ABC transporter substrate-binding protein n=1 Tax=Azospirillum sp. SYSU D00513 TaxID=2812561 RepID=UPI001A96908F|nr:choline ABC transporter substrate-binding protein [Azospirillum sp. SYSU D00513]
MRFLKQLCLAGLVGVAGTTLSHGAVSAAEPAKCQALSLSDPGWTDITTTTTTATVLLNALGYQPSVKSLSVAVSIEGLRSGNLDVFLGNWMPAQEQMTQKFIDAKSIELLATNLEGAVVTLAVNGEAAKAGVARFEDLEKHGDKFGRTIYSIEPGSSANQKIQSMIDKDAYGLGSWKMVESSEAAMLASVERSERRGQWAVFLGWAPHPMNIKMKLAYLKGGDEYFGANGGAATVRTLARAGFAGECPNLGTLFRQLRFSVAMESEVMSMILEDKVEPEKAVTSWLKAHPEALDAWLAGVSTRDGKPGLPAVRAALGLAA